jgi:lipopolysaccharide assembly protein A
MPVTQSKRSHLAQPLAVRTTRKKVRQTMRWLHTGVIVALVATTLIFAFQNFESVTMFFFGMRITAPLALVVAVVYLLGMATGGSVWALMRWAWQGPKDTAPRVS